MKKIKIFISSLIKGYEDRRDAVEAAIMELGIDEGYEFEVIRVEKLPAIDNTPQNVCLNAVSYSDVYIGIYGEKYGWKDSPVGISPTHEEFNQAKKSIDRKGILIFVEEVEHREIIQHKFLEDVGNYIDGSLWKNFKTPDDLKHEVYRALKYYLKLEYKNILPIYLDYLLKKYERIISPFNKIFGLISITKIVQLEMVEIEKQQIDYEAKIIPNNINLIRKISKTPKSRSTKLASAITNNSKVLIVGNPGAGKSTFLQWVTYTYSKQVLSSSLSTENLIPIYLELTFRAS